MTPIMFGNRELTRSSEPGAVSRLFSGVVRFVVVLFLISIVELAAVSAAERAVIILAPAIDDDRLEPVSYTHLTLPTIIRV